MRRLTLKERQLIERYLKEGYSCGEISKLITRGKNTISTEVRINGGRLKPQIISFIENTATAIAQTQLVIIRYIRIIVQGEV